MSKRREISGIMMFTAGCLTALLYQNCGGQPEFSEADLSELSSRARQSENFQQTHTDLVIDDSEPETQKAREQTDFELVLSDRWLTKAVLERIFGPSTLAADTQNFETNPLEFGSICSTYEQYRTKNSAGNYVNAAGNMNDCAINSSTTRLGATRNPRPTVVRAAMMAKTCSELVMNNTTLTFALKNISSDAIPAPTAENVKKIFGMFYEGKPAPHDALVDSLLVMMDPSKMTKDSWKAPIYTICASPHWQVM